MSFIDDPQSNDNRQYNYDENFYFRAEYPIITEWVKEGSKVIDLGCGNGALMKYILERKNVSIEGIDFSTSGVEVCKANGLKAVLGAIDQKGTYLDYSDDYFDYAICNVSLQMVSYPEIVLQEMRRISKYIIVSFPNFAHVTNRFELLFKGRMPQSMLYGYKWYNTGHIHQFSIDDFEKMIKEMDLEIVEVEHVGRWKKIANFFLPNIFSKESIYLLRKKV